MIFFKKTIQKANLKLTKFNWKAQFHFSTKIYREICLNKTKY